MSSRCPLPRIDYLEASGNDGRCAKSWRPWSISWRRRQRTPGRARAAVVFLAVFCTLTCPVYKWRQLFDTVLKSYPRGDPEDPQCAEYDQLWEQQPPGFARDAAMNKGLLPAGCCQSWSRRMVLWPQVGDCSLPGHARPDRGAPGSEHASPGRQGWTTSRLA